MIFERTIQFVIALAALVPYCSELVPHIQAIACLNVSSRIVALQEKITPIERISEHMKNNQNEFDTPEQKQAVAHRHGPTELRTRIKHHRPVEWTPRSGSDFYLG
jgi:hypothetical protein